MKARRTTGQPRAPWPLAKTLKAIDDAWEGKSSKRLNVVVGLIRSAYGLDSVVLYLVRRNARFLVQQAHTGKPTFVRESKCLLHSKRPRLENSEHRFSKVIRERNPHYENPEAKS